ncbi:biliverdin-producing heme oxygenase [Sphingomonas daechungensis]|uniref:biliverdin-producing heme oxygenase n=1 Tax=Sphingomonas daechungensis TaxID=1176646 RepID=UPI0031E7F168
MSARSYLRSITRPAHDRVDALFSAFDLSDDRSYADFLAAQAAAFLPIEEALEKAGAARLLQDWPQRRRSDALRADLAALSRPLPTRARAPDYADEASIWGGLYVLEGSRLGGAVLRKDVGEHLPKSFLSPSPKGSWAAFVAELERNLYGSVVLHRAGVSALNTFACFENL